MNRPASKLSADWLTANTQGTWRPRSFVKRLKSWHMQHDLFKYKQIYPDNNMTLIKLAAQYIPLSLMGWKHPIKWASKHTGLKQHSTSSLLKSLHPTKDDLKRKVTVLTRPPAHPGSAATACCKFEQGRRTHARTYPIKTLRVSLPNTQACLTWTIMCSGPFAPAWSEASPSDPQSCPVMGHWKGLWPLGSPATLPLLLLLTPLSLVSPPLMPVGWG